MSESLREGHIEPDPLQTDKGTSSHAKVAHRFRNSRPVVG